MSHSVLAPAEPGAPTVPSPALDRSRIGIVATLLILGSLAAAVLVVWQPWGQRNALGYADIAPNRDAAWLGMLVDGLAIAVVGVTLGLAACRLTPRRGGVWASIGAVLAGLGGLAFCAGAFAFGSLAWYATATDALDVPAGTALMSYVETHSAHVYGVQGAGFLLLTLGSLLLMVGLWRAAAVPRWLPIAYAVLTVGLFVLTGAVLNIVQAAQLLLPVVVAYVLVRRPQRLGS